MQSMMNRQQCQQVDTFVKNTINYRELKDKKRFMLLKLIFDVRLKIFKNNRIVSNYFFKRLIIYLEHAYFILHAS